MSLDPTLLLQRRAAGPSPFTRLGPPRPARGRSLRRFAMLALGLAMLWVAGSGSGQPVVAEPVQVVSSSPSDGPGISPPPVEVAVTALAPPVLLAPPPPVTIVAPQGFRIIDGRLHRPTRKLKMRVTSYCHRACCCGSHADQRTASGRPVWTNGGRLVAADTRLLPFGTHVSIPGYHGGEPVPVLDRGGRIKGHRLDVLRPTHRQASAWGVHYLDVVVWEPVPESGQTG